MNTRMREQLRAQMPARVRAARMNGTGIIRLTVPEAQEIVALLKVTAGPPPATALEALKTNRHMDGTPIGGTA